MMTLLKQNDSILILGNLSRIARRGPGTRFFETVVWRNPRLFLVLPLSSSLIPLFFHYPFVILVTGSLVLWSPVNLEDHQELDI